MKCSGRAVRAHGFAHGRLGFFWRGDKIIAAPASEPSASPRNECSDFAGWAKHLDHPEFEAGADEHFVVVLDGVSVQLD